MEKYTSNFQLTMHARDADIVRLGVDREGNEDCGLYGSRVRNDFGTSLLARGTREEMERLKREGP